MFAKILALSNIINISVQFNTTVILEVESLRYIKNKMSSANNFVYLWIDPIYQKSCPSFLNHTTIFVRYENGSNYTYSYNEDGLTCESIVCYFVLNEFI